MVFFWMSNHMTRSYMRLEDRRKRKIGFKSTANFCFYLSLSFKHISSKHRALWRNLIFCSLADYRCRLRAAGMGKFKSSTKWDLGVEMEDKNFNIHLFLHNSHLNKLKLQDVWYLFSVFCSFPFLQEGDRPIILAFTEIVSFFSFLWDVKCEIAFEAVRSM